MLKDWNFWCSIITALVAIVALFLSIHQIKLSNKQSLFDRRLKAYMLANGLISLCKDNYKWISEERADAIDHPLEQPFHKEFLRKREELRNSAMEVELIFRGEAALTYSEFLRAYESALATMYQYQIIIDKMMKENEKHPMTLEKAGKMFSEENYRNNLYNALEKLKKTYDVAIQDNIKKQMEKQLRLI